MNEAPPSQGLVAGKYQLVRMIGRGGMGSVWEAKHVSLGTPSAIKFIESEYADSQEARSRFDKEARAAATIQSKHAIQIYDHGVTDDGKPYIVMELLQGEPLDKCIDRQRLSLQETARILQQVCRGLARAHERGIVHRDLKPENIFLVKTPDEDETVAKVLDFGIAKDLNKSAGISGGITSGTKTGAVLGTPFYMSPEQARGLRNVDHRADVWSLGVIAFKCITGKLPFDGESVGDLLVKICTAPVPIPSQTYPGIPPNFDAWFMRALEREPERRFGNVTEFADALCFAAGIATRSQGTPSYVSTPIASIGATGAMGAMLTPNHQAMSGSAGSQPGGYPMQTPMQTPSGGYGAPPPQGHDPMAHMAQRTPAPAAMTNAPFTSEHVPGVPSGRGKIILGGLAASVLVIGATTIILLFIRRGPVAHSDSTNGVVASPPTTTTSVAATPPASSVITPATPLPREEPPPATGPGAGGTPAPPKPTGSTKLAVQPKPPKPTPPPPLPSTAPSPTTPSPPAPAPAPTPTPKKPNKNDPGY